MIVPSVHVEPPPGWVAAAVQPPDLAAGSDSVVSTWRADSSPEGGERLVSGCIATPIAGWLDEMRAPIEARNVALVASMAERIHGGPVEARAEGARLVLREAGAPLSVPYAGTARTFLGWGPGQVSTCFVACVALPAGRAAGRGSAPPGPEAPLTCEAAVLTARLEGSTDPPPPGVALRAVRWAVYHPAKAATAGAALVAAASVIAVASRRKPRARI